MERAVCSPIVENVSQPKDKREVVPQASVTCKCGTIYGALVSWSCRTDAYSQEQFKTKNEKHFAHSGRIEISTLRSLSDTYAAGLKAATVRCIHAL